MQSYKEPVRGRSKARWCWSTETKLLHSLLFFCLLALTGETVDATEYMIEILAVSSFKSEATLAQAEVEFGTPVSTESLEFVNAASGEEVEFYFVPEPGEPYAGWIFWEWEEMGFFEERNYILYASEGDWSVTPMGCKAISAQVSEDKFLAPNYIFEEVTDGEPDGWEISGAAELSEEEAFRGRRSIKMESEIGTEPHIRVPNIPLEPETRYRLTFWYKITEWEDSGRTSQPIAGDLWSRGEKGQWLVRALVHRNTAGGDPEEVTGEWRKLTAMATTCPEAVFGTLRIWSHSNFSGIFHVDRVFVEKAPEGAPHRVEVSAMKKASDQ